MTKYDTSETTGFKITGGPDYPFIDPDKLAWKTDSKFTLHAPPILSGWKCYMFGTKPGVAGWIYVPSEGLVPNWFVRWMMKICLGCTWVYTKEQP